MTEMVALLRGINVGGRRMAMADLRAAAESAGLTAVGTYVQSGNVIFDAGRRSPATVERSLADSIRAHTGLAVEMAIRTAADIDRIVADNPFTTPTGSVPQIRSQGNESAGQNGLTTLHVVLRLDRPPGAGSTADELPTWYEPEQWEPEKLAVVGGETYLHLPDGMGRSKLALEVARRGDRTGGVRGTARNWRTMLALQERLSGGRTANP